MTPTHSEGRAAAKQWQRELDGRVSGRTAVIMWATGLTATQLAAVCHLFRPGELKRVLLLKAANNRKVARLRKPK